MKPLYTLILSLLCIISHAQLSITAKSGKWSDPLTWVSKKLPAATDKVIVNAKHVLTIDGNNDYTKMYYFFIAIPIKAIFNNFWLA